MDFNGIVGGASNVRTGSNPPFLVGDFLSMYPQFGPDGSVQLVPLIVIQSFIDMADASINQKRWRTSWSIAMGWYVAHFCTLYLEGAASQGSDAATVIAAGQAKGFITSESAGPVSASTDYSSLVQDLDGWAAWKLTIYGQQLATMSKIYGKGGMYVY